MKKLLAMTLVFAMLLTCALSSAEVLTGTSAGFGGDITAEVTVEDGKITDLKLTGDAETPAIGGAALAPLTEAILAAGTVEGVDAISGATWTSNGVFGAIRAALGETEEAAAVAVTAVSAGALKQGIGIQSTPRLGPGSDANGVGVYSFNEVIAYVITDSEDRIMDLELDIVEIITPNHDESNEGDNFLAGWPGQTYNSDAEGDGVVDGELTETEEIFTGEIGTWLTKREKHADYKMNSGTWEGEMDIFEQFFIGKTIDELRAWAAKYTSDSNGRPINAASTKEEDVAKYNALTDEEKAVCDAVTGATMSVSDSHGEIIEAIAKAIANAEPMSDVSEVSKIGLGINVTPRLGPGADDQGVNCYSFNVVASGVALNGEGRIQGIYCDVMEIITPNHDGAEDNAFTGWPGQSYNADLDADGKVDTVLEQTEETFVQQIASYKTKRSIGDGYKMNSDTWKGEMSGYESAMKGMTREEVEAWFAACFSDLNGRSLHGASTKDEDVAKYAAMTEEQKAGIDAIASATMSLNDAHGDLIGTILEAFDVAKTADITVK